MNLIEIKRLFTRPEPYISFIIGLLILNRPLIEAMLTGAIDSGSISQYLSVPFAMSDFTPFAAVFCVLPYANSFCEDYNTRFFRFIVCRSGTKKYAFSKSVITTISGGLVMSAIVFSTIILCGILADSPETPDKIEFMRDSIWVRSGIIYVMNGYLYLFLRVLLAFLFGCVWSSIGLTISTFITNRYVTYIAPFVIYQMMWFVFDETKWNPVYLLRCDSNFIPSLTFVFTYQSILILVFLTTSILMITRRVYTWSS